MAWQILPFLFLGNSYDANNLIFLKNNNIKTVISVWELKLINIDDNIKYYNFFAYDNPNQNLYDIIFKCFDIIEKNKVYGNILIHCFQFLSGNDWVGILFITKFRL